MQKLAVSTLLVTTAFPLSGISSSSLLDEERFEIKSSEIFEVDERLLGSDKSFKSLNDDLDFGVRDENLATTNSSDVGLISEAIDDVLMLGDKFAVVGKKVWKVIEANRPVVEVGPMLGHHVLPKEAFEGAARPLTIEELNRETHHTLGVMEGWSMPSSRTYQINLKNAFGMRVVKFIFTVRAVHGGQYQGQGRYLSSVAIEARKLEVMWGFNVNINSVLESVINMGTSESPVAGVLMSLKFKAKTAVTDASYSDTFLINGRGEIRAID
jgi:hypothetical protein